MSVREKLEADLDKAADAIRAIKAAGHQLHELNEAQRMQLEEIGSQVAVLFSTGLFRNNDQVIKDLTRIDERLERLRELRNICELGSFMVEIDKKMETAWESLPH